jgi:hypothetical protein
MEISSVMTLFLFGLLQILLPDIKHMKRKSKETKEKRQSKERSLGDRLRKLDSLGLSCPILSL